LYLVEDRAEPVRRERRSVGVLRSVAWKARHGGNLLIEELRVLALDAFEFDSDLLACGNVGSCTTRGDRTWWRCQLLPLPQPF
jgi:hypothetical protein